MIQKILIIKISIHSKNIKKIATKKLYKNIMINIITPLKIINKNVIQLTIMQ